MPDNSKFKITFTDNNISNNGTVFSVPAGFQGNIEAAGNTMNNNREVLLVRDPQSILARIGLPPNTPHELVIEVLQILLKQEQSTDAKRDRLKETRLFIWLSQRGFAAMSVVADLVSLHDSATVQSWLTALSSGTL